MTTWRIIYEHGGCQGTQESAYSIPSTDQTRRRGHCHGTRPPDRFNSADQKRQQSGQFGGEACPACRAGCVVVADAETSEASASSKGFWQAYLEDHHRGSSMIYL